MEYKIVITGNGTRESIAKGLRLIATALDGTGEFPMQAIGEINGAEWNDCSLTSEIKVLHKDDPTFSWTDKSGRGFNGRVSLSDIDNDPEEVNWDGKTLFEWAQMAEPGDVWENSTDRYTCISED